MRLSRAGKQEDAWPEARGQRMAQEAKTCVRIATPMCAPVPTRSSASHDPTIMAAGAGRGKSWSTPQQTREGVAPAYRI